MILGRKYEKAFAISMKLLRQHGKNPLEMSIEVKRMIRAMKVGDFVVVDADNDDV